MTYITWKNELSEEEIKIADELGRVVLSDGQATIMISQQKMLGYLQWIMHQELKHGGI